MPLCYGDTPASTSEELPGIIGCCQQNLSVGITLLYITHTPTSHAFWFHFTTMRKLGRVFIQASQHLVLNLIIYIRLGCLSSTRGWTLSLSCLWGKHCSNESSPSLCFQAVSDQVAQAALDLCSPGGHGLTPSLLCFCLTGLVLFSWCAHYAFFPEAFCPGIDPVSASWSSCSEGLNHFLPYLPRVTEL